MTKAQGLPLNTIIIAILGVAVLAILIAFTIGGLGANTKDLTSCDIKQGICVAERTDCVDQDSSTAEGVIISSGKNQCEKQLEKDTAVCCVKPKFIK